MYAEKLNLILECNEFSLCVDVINNLYIKVVDFVHKSQPKKHINFLCDVDVQFDDIFYGICFELEEDANFDIDKHLDLIKYQLNLLYDACYIFQKEFGKTHKKSKVKTMDRFIPEFIKEDKDLRGIINYSDRNSIIYMESVLGQYKIIISESCIDDIKDFMYVILTRPNDIHNGICSAQSVIKETINKWNTVLENSNGIYGFQYDW